MATAKPKASASADTTSQSGESSGELASQTDTGVNNGPTSDSDDDLPSGGAGGVPAVGATDGGGVVGGVESGGESSGVLASSAAPDSISTASSDDVQTSATGGADLPGSAADATGAVTDGRQPTQAAAVEMALAVVIYAGGSTGREIGDVVEGPVPVIERLARAGDLDPHPDAVAIARSRGAKLFQLEV
jgi:hypothetical protein